MICTLLCIRVSRVVSSSCGWSRYLERAGHFLTAASATLQHIYKKVSYRGYTISTQ
jgi:hypothetical protein